MKPIAMKCTQEQYDKIKPILLENGFKEESITSFKDYPYLINNWGPNDYVLGNGLSSFTVGRKVFEEWNEDTFLEYCGIKKEENMFTIEDLAEGKCAVINDGTLEELEEVLKLAFPDDKSVILGMYKYYIPNYKNWYPADITIKPTQSVKDFLKQINMEKEIIGYKLIKPEYEKAAIEIAKVSNKNWNGFINGSFVSNNKSVCVDYEKYVHRLKKAGVLDLWFEPVYKTQETKYTMGSNDDTFELVVRNDKCFHKEEDITDYVKSIQKYYSGFISNTVINNYSFNVKDIILSKTGCENKETLLSQWLNIKL